MLEWKYTEEGLDHKNLQEITIKYHFNHIKHRYGLHDKSRKQCNTIFADKKLAIKVITDFRTISARSFRVRLGFWKYDVTLTKKQSVLTKIMNPFEEENMQHNIMF